MNSTPARQRVCCTCKYFGNPSKRMGSNVQWESLSTHICKIHARGNGNQGCMNSACSKWEEKV